MDPSLASIIRAANTEIIVKRRSEAIAEYFTPDYVAHATDHEVRGHAAIRQFLGLLQNGFPDLQVEVEILVEGGDRVAWQRTLRGTHQGHYMGFPPSGRPTVWRDMFTSRFRDGRIAEDWVLTDLAERLLLARKG